MRSSKNGRMWEAVERKLGHVTSAKLLQIEQRHFIHCMAFKWLQVEM